MGDLEKLMFRQRGSGIMAYCKDKDLEILASASDEDLQILVDYLIKDKDGSPRLTEELTLTEGYKNVLINQVNTGKKLLVSYSILVGMVLQIYLGIYLATVRGLCIEKYYVMYVIR